MKTLFLLITLTPLLTFANTPDFPEGEFGYDSSEVYSTSHQHILNLKSPKGKNLYNNYRSLGYTCKHFPNSFVKCRRLVDENPNGIKFNTKKLKALSPNFGTLKVASLVNESDFVDIYEIQQNVDFNSSTTENYKAYKNYRAGKLFLDIETDSIKPKRFEYVNNELILQSTEKENISKNEFYIHTVYSIFTTDF